MGAFHYLDFSVFCQATEDRAKVLQALRFLAGTAKVREERVEGFCGNQMLVMRAQLKSKKDVDAFWARIAEAGLLGRILGELDARLDDDCTLFVRFGKQAAYRGEISLEKDGGVIEMRAKVAAFPAKRERALAVAREYLEHAALAG